MWYQFKPYVSVARRKAKAAREVARLAKKGRTISPVKLEGRTIAATFWGKAWCDNLEAYSDFANRLPRGRSYIRNGSVVDLQIRPGKITALVSGSALYEVTITITAFADKDWKSLKAKCAGQIGSLVELLQGKLSKSVMNIVTQRQGGMFPKPPEISIKCSCPDWAGLCKHAAAVLYGVGSRLDREPETFFKLRRVDHLELVEAAVAAPAASTRKQRGKKTIAASDLADVFGIEMAEPAAEAAVVSPDRKAAKRKTAVASTTKGRVAAGKTRLDTAAAVKRAAASPKSTLPKTRKAAKVTKPAAPRRTAGSKTGSRSAF